MLSILSADLRVVMLGSTSGVDPGCIWDPEEISGIWDPGGYHVVGDMGW